MLASACWLLVSPTVLSKCPPMISFTISSQMGLGASKSIAAKIDNPSLFTFTECDYLCLPTIYSYYSLFLKNHSYILTLFSPSAGDITQKIELVRAFPEQLCWKLTALYFFNLSLHYEIILFSPLKILQKCLVNNPYPENINGGYLSGAGFTV